MRAVLALTALTSIVVVFSHEHTGQELHVRQRLLQRRELRKDYGSSDYHYGSSDYHYGSSSSKSGKGSDKSGKGSSKSSKGSSKSGKGSKSGKSSKSSRASYDDGGYGQGSSGKGGESSDVHSTTSEYDAKAPKWHEQADDDDIYDLGGNNEGGSDDELTGSSVSIDDEMLDDFDDFTNDDIRYEDDSTIWEESSSNNEDGNATESSVADPNGAETSSGTSDGGIEDVVDDSLNQNSWLVDIIHEDEDHSEDDDNVTDHNSLETVDDGAKNEDTTPADENDPGDEEMGGNGEGVVSGSETSNDSVQDSKLTDESESFWGVLNPETDWTSSMSQNDFSMSMDLQEDQLPDFDLDSSMSTYPLDDNLPELDQFEVEFVSMSMPKLSDDEWNPGGSDDDGSVTDETLGDYDDDNVNDIESDEGNGSNNGTDDAANNEATDDNVADDDDSDSDDGIESSNGNSDELSHLTVQERTQIIRKKCNTTPLGRALSLIRIIGNRVDPQHILSQSADSPQYLAFLWLVYLDDAILCPPPFQEDLDAASAFDGEEEDITRWLAKNNNANSIRALSPTVATSIVERHEILDRIMQRYALAMLYYTFHGYGWENCPSDRNFFNTSTLGDCVSVSGDELVRFLDSAHECTWFGISCALNATKNMNVDAHIPVTRLELPGISLYGNIPQDISLLFSLEVVDLRDNDLTGTIPFDAFATMDNLDTLILSGNKQLSGNANRYCESGSSLNEMLMFETDCTPLVEELKPAPVQCSCCTSCL